MKRREYFVSGIRLYQKVLADARQVRVYLGRNEFEMVSDGDILTGEPVLTGFRLPIMEWFAYAGNRPVA